MTRGRDDLIDEADDEFSLQPMLRTLWSYRRTIVVALAITMVTCILAGLLLYVRAPSERIASLGFQLLFDGADQNEYPNGTVFSSAEIVSTPVLTEVYRANELQRYVTFPDFKESMFVLHANRRLELLSYEYEAKLADPKLTPVDRDRLEEEFATKGESLRSAQYSLNMRRSEGAKKIPGVMLGKVLQDTLSTWAVQAAERKGAIYDLPILSKNALQKDLLGAEDYIVAVDILRAKTERVVATLDLIGKIPGAATVRMEPDQISIADIRANVEDQLRFTIEPLMSDIRTGGLSRNRRRMEQYFQGRLFEVQLAHAAATQRIASMQEALRDYERRNAPQPAAAADPRALTMTPQLSETFIDKLVDLSTRAVDVEYRQDLTKRVVEEGMVLAELARQVKYYESMQRSFSPAAGGSDSVVAADVTRRTAAAFDQLGKSMDQIQDLYALISRQNLNPNSVVYSITRPFTERTISSLPMRTTLLYTFVTLCFALIAIPAGCLAHNYFRSRISPPKAPQSGTASPPPQDVERIAGV